MALGIKKKDRKSKGNIAEQGVKKGLKWIWKALFPGNYIVIGIIFIVAIFITFIHEVFDSLVTIIETTI